MMKTLKTWTAVWMATGSLLLGAPAWADGSCRQDCEADANQCKAVCKKHAGTMVARCSQACADEKEACLDACGSGGSSSRQEPDARKPRKDDHDAHH